MFRTVILPIICFAPLFGAGIAFEPGELVVAARSIPLREQAKVNDEVAAGQVLRVLAIAESRLWVSRGKPGWVDQSQVLPLDQAEQFFSSAIKTTATAPSYLARGNARLALGNHQAGLQDIRQALELSGGSSEYLEPLAYAQLAAMQLAEAAQTFQLVLAQKPAYAPALMGRGVAYYQLGNHQAAVDDLSSAIKLEPQHAFPHKYLGALYYDQSKFELARHELDLAITLDMFDPFARKVRGRLHFDSADYPAALADFGVALQVAPTDIEALTGRGIVAHAIGTDLEQAKQDFKRAVELGTETEGDAYLWSNLGQVQMDLGEESAAYKNLTHAIELDPAFNEARSHRAYLIANSRDASRGMLNLAKDDVRKVFASQASRTFWDYRALAAVNAASGDFARAYKYQQQAEETVRTTGPARFLEPAAQAKLRYHKLLAEGREK